jgi:hypothetical protein|tara:strand:- start:5057 stop:5533 length:477 start_codon:yes stop_codon:yes gene_type:complete
MSLRLWDFACECGKRYDSYPCDGAKIPKTIKCECGKRAGWAMGGKHNHIHRTISTLYGRGVVDPQTGVDYESYEHKQQVLREQGKTEGDVERFDDIMSEDPSDFQDTGPRSADLDYVDADTDEEAQQKIMEKLQTDPRLDRRRTGDARTQFVDEGIPI